MTIWYILDLVNIFFIIMITLAISVQLIYVMLCFVKKTSFAHTDKIHKIKILVPARNEESVIGELIENLKMSDYPQDAYEIVVVAHNCTDNTAAVAASHGARVLEYSNNDERIKAYALKYAMDKLKDDEFDFYLIFDADNLVAPDFFRMMNDAFASGVELARGHNNSKNYFDNSISSTSSLYYIRDARYNAQVRERLGLNSILQGTGEMLSKKFIDECGGFPSTSISEDADVTIQAMLKGKKVHYVSDAEFYEEHPTTVKDVFTRNRRMGFGLSRLFGKSGGALLLQFFKTGKFTFLDIFLTLIFIPISVVATIWFPCYYIAVILNAIFGSHVIISFGAVMAGSDFVWTILWVVVVYFLSFMAQGGLAVYLDRDRLPDVPWYKYIKSVVLTPVFMILYCISITIGVCSPTMRWKPVRRKNDLKKESGKNNGTDQK